jgi:phosphoglycerol transferase MdoB-like AlkP superfamily enzyme
MRKRIGILLRLAIFWMVLMTIVRITFIIYNYELAAQLTWTDIIKSLIYGLQMDASMTGFLLLVAGVILTVSVFYQGKWVYYTLNSFNIFMLLLTCVTVMVDLELYHHWGFRLNTTPFMYMGSGAAGSVSVGLAIRLITILLVLFSSFTFLYFRFIAPYIKLINPTKNTSALVLFLLTALMFIPIRGGFSVSSMNVGWVYFHKTNNFANHSGINVLWHLFYSIKSDKHVKYPENFFDKTLTETYFQKLYPQDDSTTHVLNTNRPNVILVIMESFTANVIEALGGKPGITPNLNKLCQEGILFDSIYATGDRTDRGLVGILAAYPSQPVRPIIKYPGRTQKLSYLSRKLEALNYKTSFVYGGDADFANYRSLLTYAGFQHLTSVDDFDDDLDNSKWGVHDEFLFEQVKKELDTTSTDQPFFKTVLTLSSHEPFDVPLKQIKGETPRELFLNSCYYTDKYLGEFVDYCKKQPWWDNTLIIVVADHGHRLPDIIDLRIREKFRIPLLWLGGAIKKDTVIHTLGGQTDITNTLLAQIDKPSPEFTFSKNLLGNNVQNFAVYIFNDGYAFLSPTKYILYDNPGKLYLKKEGVSTKEDLYFGKAYMQKLYSDYNARK